MPSDVLDVGIGPLLEKKVCGWIVLTVQGKLEACLTLCICAVDGMVLVIPLEVHHGT